MGQADSAPLDWLLARSGLEKEASFFQVTSLSSKVPAFGYFGVPGLFCVSSSDSCLLVPLERGNGGLPARWEGVSSSGRVYLIPGLCECLRVRKGVSGLCFRLGVFLSF